MLVITKDFRLINPCEFSSQPEPTLSKESLSSSNPSQPPLNRKCMFTNFQELQSMPKQFFRLATQ